MKKIFSFFIIFFLLFSNSFAFDIDKVYNNFYNRISKNYTETTEKINHLENIGKTFIKVKNNSKKNSIKKLLDRLIFLNNKKILELKKLIKNSEKLDKKKLNNKKVFLEKQKILEENIRKNFLKELGKINLTKEVSYLKNKGFDVIFVNDDFEFVENNKIKKIFFKKYFLVDKNSYKLLEKKDKKTKIIVLDDNNFFVEDYNIEEKIPFSKASLFFKNFITDKKNYVLDSGVYYTFLFENYLLNNDNYGFYKSNIEKNGVFFDKTILYYDSKKFAFVNDYKKQKLIEKSFLEDLGNKDLFLKILSQDIKKVSGDYSKDLRDLKNFSKNLTKGLSREQKIKKIYSYIVDNLEYFTGDYNKHKEVFSGILTFKNKIAVCEGYVRLFSYMALFSGINDIEIIRGYVFNSPDFPKVGHAWLKIEGKYYDPTFDDPIGNKGDILEKDYLFFGLEKDLFYTNRFDFLEKEKFEKYRKMSLEDREKIVEKNLYLLLDKYKNFNLLKMVKIKKELGFLPGEKITIEKLKKRLKFYKVDKNFNFIDENGIKRKMKKIEYFTINDKNVENLLKQLGEKFLNSYLLKKGKTYYLATIFEFK